MKKLLLLIVITLLATTSIFAQEIASKAIGLRFGDNDGLGAEINYQHALGDTNRLEAGLAWSSNSYYSKIKVTGLYQWVWDLAAIENMNWYAGAGGGIGSWKLKDDVFGQSEGKAFLFVAGDVGVEYKFDIPLLLSLDFRPEFGFSNLTSGLGFDIALGVRYTF